MTVSRKFIQLIIFAICLSCLGLNSAEAQDKKPTSFQDTLLHKVVYLSAEQLPEPQGGLEALLKQLTKTIRYPPGDVDFVGKVIVAFVIEPNGKIDGERVIREPSGDKQIFSKQIFEVVKAIKWKPARRNAKAVPFLYTLPVTIDLTE